VGAVGRNVEVGGGRCAVAQHDVGGFCRQIDQWHVVLGRYRLHGFRIAAAHIGFGACLLGAPVMTAIGTDRTTFLIVAHDRRHQDRIGALGADFRHVFFQELVVGVLSLVDGGIHRVSRAGTGFAVGAAIAAISVSAIGGVVAAVFLVVMAELDNHIIASIDLRRDGRPACGFVVEAARAAAAQRPVLHGDIAVEELLHGFAPAHLRATIRSVNRHGRVAQHVQGDAAGCGCAGVAAGVIGIRGVARIAAATAGDQYGAEQRGTEPSRDFFHETILLHLFFRHCQSGLRHLLTDWNRC